MTWCSAVETHFSQCFLKLICAITQGERWFAYKLRKNQSDSDELKIRLACRRDLRKYQALASNQLATLDKTYGRLDKNFSHWVKQNSKLEPVRLLCRCRQNAGKIGVTSKLRGSTVPPKRLQNKAHFSFHQICAH